MSVTINYKTCTKTYNIEDIKKLQELADRSAIFFNDVLPQIGGLCVQDFANVNELGMLIDKYVEPETRKAKRY